MNAFISSDITEIGARSARLSEKVRLPKNVFSPLRHSFRPVWRYLKRSRRFRIGGGSLPARYCAPGYRRLSAAWAFLPGARIPCWATDKSRTERYASPCRALFRLGRACFRTSGDTRRLGPSVVRGRRLCEEGGSESLVPAFRASDPRCDSCPLMFAAIAATRRVPSYSFPLLQPVK